MEALANDPRYLVATAVAVILLGWCYNVLTNPLAKLPGPWYSNWTRLVLIRKQLSGTKPLYVHQLHLKYGPVVRIGPREASIQDPAAARQIFRVKGEFLKSDWYHLFPNVNVFSATDVEVHRRYRKLLSAAISESGLVQHRAVVDAKVRLTLQRMGEETETRGATDVFYWWMCMTTDTIGELSFGESFRVLETGKMNQYMQDLQAIGAGSSIRETFPTLVKSAVKLPIPFIVRAKNLTMRMRRYAEQSLERHHRIVEEEGEDAKPTLFSKVYKAGEEGLPFVEILNNATAYLVAGSDTTSNTLTYVTWSILKHPEVRAKLLDELRTLPENFDYEHVKDLPYLNQTIEETLRLYAVVPVGLPRVVPDGGATFLNHYIPGGYTVSAQSYSMHRNSAVFPEPLKFDPTRWENPTQEMKDSFIAFGGGSRICIGLHLARMELRLGIARFFTQFPNAKISAKEGFGDEDMEPKLYFLSSPKNKRCLIEVS